MLPPTRQGRHKTDVASRLIESIVQQESNDAARTPIRDTHTIAARRHWTRHSRGQHPI